METKNKKRFTIASVTFMNDEIPSLLIRLKDEYDEENGLVLFITSDSKNIGNVDKFVEKSIIVAKDNNFKSVFSFNYDFALWFARLGFSGDFFENTDKALQQFVHNYELIF